MSEVQCDADRFGGRCHLSSAMTLVEILIVVVIMGIVLALALPMTAETSVSKLRAAAHLVQADLAFAQNESVSHGDDPRVVVFDTASDTYHIAASSDSATPITNPADGMPYSVTFGSRRAAGLNGVGLAAVSVGGDDELGFGLYGELDQTAAATITLSCAGKSITVSIDPTTGESSVGSIN